MQQEIEITTLFQTISKLEKELRELRSQVAQLAAQQDRQRVGKRKPKSNGAAKLKSGYGMFPPSNTTMEDFRDARASWTRNLDRTP